MRGNSRRFRNVSQLKILKRCRFSCFLRLQKIGNLGKSLETPSFPKISEDFQGFPKISKDFQRFPKFSKFRQKKTKNCHISPKCWTKEQERKPTFSVGAFDALFGKGEKDAQGSISPPPFGFALQALALLRSILRHFRDIQKRIVVKP